MFDQLTSLLNPAATPADETDEWFAAAEDFTNMEDTTLSLASGPPATSTSVSHLQLWQDSVNARPNAIALISRHQKPTHFRWVGSQHNDLDFVQWTYSDLDRGARRLATALNRLTHIERRPIATIINTQAEWALFCWAAAYLHSPLVPINPKVVSRSKEISHMLAMTQPAVVICGDATIAAQLEQSLSEEARAAIPVKLLSIPSDEMKSSGWSSLSDAMSGDPSPPDTPDMVDPKDTCMTLFTSGTTSLPKPCNITSSMYVNAGMGYKEARQINSGHKLVQHLPNFHSYGIAWSFCFWFAGGTVVLPSEAFEAQASLETFDMFKTTHMSLVPTTAQAILAHPYFATADLSTLVSIDVSGAGVLPSVIESCVHGLKVPSYTSYGMTEAPGTLIWPEDQSSVVRNGEVLSGKCARGTKVKVCEPGTRNIIPRGQAGELHNGGAQVVHGYSDPNVNSSDFYVDENGTQWIVSGDQAVMENDGGVRISGRYKDMIIRGGENISPASIEDYLRKMDGVASAEVVGVPDEMAGEVPIAIITIKDGQTVNASELKNATSHDLGPAFAPKMVLQLKQDLGMNAWPTTASGKVRKVELRAVVREYLQKQEASRSVDTAAPTIDSLIRIWQGISGTDSLSGETDIQSFADSLMMMQLSGMVKKQLGKDVTVEDYKMCDTIQQQAELIDSKPQVGAKLGPQKPERKGPPTAEDMPFLADSDAFDDVKATVTNTMATVGLEWKEVEDVMPLPDWDAIFCHKSRPTSWNLRFSYHAPCSARKLEAAVMESLTYHPTLRAMGVEEADGRMLLVSVRNTEEWRQVAMTSGWQVETKEDLNKLLLDHPEFDCASLPGPLVRIHFATVRSDGSSGLIFVGSHATNDMSMTKLWLDDVSAILTGESTPLPHAQFKDYANAFAKHREGTESDNGVAYWTHKMQGVSTVPESSLWPPQRAAEWFKGVDTNWARWSGAKARRGERCVAIDEKRRAQKGLRRMVKVQDITRLKSEHGVPVFMLVKAAIALLNIAKTGGKEAVFGTINAARTWPFSSDYTPLEREACSGNPLDVSGCTTEYLFDRIPVGQSKSVLAFMQQVTKDEEHNSAYAHTPFFRIIDRLRDPLSAEDARSFAERERDAEAILPLIRRQSFNWLPTAPNAQSNPKGMKMLEMLTRMDNGLTITGFLADDKKSVCVGFSWDAEHLSFREAERSLDQLVTFVERMGKEDEWAMSVGEMLRV
ncbi:NRPS protein [Elasticomyces elasticus]|nr:NRPS protein [Elasticomyces elasticus]